MTRNEKTNDMAWIEPKDLDRYWHLQPAEVDGNHGTVGTNPLAVRRQRIRRAQYAAVGSLRCV